MTKFHKVFFFSSFVVNQQNVVYLCLCNKRHLCLLPLGEQASHADTDLAALLLMNSSVTLHPCRASV